MATILPFLLPPPCARLAEDFSWEILHKVGGIPPLSASCTKLWITSTTSSYSALTIEDKAIRTSCLSPTQTERSGGSTPSARWGHHLFVAHNRMYSFGGYNGQLLALELVAMTLPDHRVPISHLFPTSNHISSLPHPPLSPYLFPHLMASFYSILSSA